MKSQTIKTKNFGNDVLVRHDYFGNQLQKIKSYIKTSVKFILPFLKKDMRIIDIGAADGYLGKIIKKNINQITIYSIDKYPASKEVEEMDFYNLGGIGKFDFVILNHTLEHADSPYKLMQQVEKISKPKTMLFIAVPYALDPWAYELYESTTHYACFTPDFLRTLVSRFGFLIHYNRLIELRIGYREIWLLAEKL